MLTHAIRIHERGGPEVMRFDEIEIPEPAPGEVRIRNTAIGLNFIDPGHRSGVRLEYRHESAFPIILGTEGAGVVEAIGPGVEGWEVGTRVAYWYAPPSCAYSERLNYPVEWLVRLPEDISNDVAAAVLCKGMTAEMLACRVWPVNPGDTVLAQWLKHLGATVIGTMSTDEKAAMARAHGCDHTVVYTRDDFVRQVWEISDAKGAAVVYEGVGQDTYLDSLDCLGFRGVCLLYGFSSGPVKCIDPFLIHRKGCLFVSRPSVHQYNKTVPTFMNSAAALFAMIRSGAIKVHIGQRYALADVASAHRDLEARRTIGATILVP
jgi:NADPH2:quinone reductase